MNIEEIKQSLSYKEFPAVHEEFYKEYSTWRAGIKEEDNMLFDNCVYILTSDKPVPRAHKEDHRGILYIGKGQLTKNRERPGALINAINETSVGQHGVGNLYSPLKEMYPLEKLKLTLYFTDKPRDTEGALLKAYHNEFGELPPLNSLF